MAEDTAVTIKVSDLIANNKGVYGGIRAVYSMDGGGGKAFLSADRQTVTFIPDANYTGPAAFEYVFYGDSFGTAGASATAFINVTAVNDAPEQIALSAATVVEHSASGTPIGSLSAVDVEGHSLSYTLRDDAGGRFAIEHGKLVAADASWLDYDQVASYQVVVRVTDSDGAFTDKAFTITLKGINERPTDLTLSIASVEENTPTGTVFASLLPIDPDAGDTFRFELLDNAEGRFALDGGKVVVADGRLLDFEQAASHQIRVRVTDAGNLSFEKTLTIGVGDIPVEIVRGTSKGDSLKGGAGRDVLYGGRGKDTLWGGAGQDAFAFDTKPNKKSNLDRISDFNPKDDSIWLENKVFTKLGKAGSTSKPVLIKSGFFKVNDKAKDLNDHILYNKKTGYLMYDVDGSGIRYKPIEIALLKKGLSLSYKDILVI